MSVHVSLSLLNQLWNRAKFAEHLSLFTMTLINSTIQEH